MVWKWLKAFFSKSSPEPKTFSPEVHWLAAEESPWRVPVLDVQGVTQYMQSAAEDPVQAENLISFARDDGRGFVGVLPASERQISVELSFPIEGILADGVLFVPQMMEHKWAIYYHGNELIFIRSWLREVYVVASCAQDGDRLHVNAICGWFCDENEDAAFSSRVLSFLLLSHVQDQIIPAPLPPEFEDPKLSALWCMRMFGNRVRVASCQPVAFPMNKPLRSHSLLHIAAAQGDREAVQHYLQKGLPADLLAADGLPPIQWALATGDVSFLEFLISCGAAVDARSVEGATPLMTATQDGVLEIVRFFIDKGGVVTAQDQRGFTALHRAAEMGHADVAKLLLGHGAEPDAEAEGGHTPRSLAQRQGHTRILLMMNQ